MITALLAVFLAAHVVLLGWSFQFLARIRHQLPAAHADALATKVGDGLGLGPHSPRLWILRLLLAGMIYDNLILTLGNVGVGSSWYVAATTGRFVLHAVVLPLLIPFGLSAMRACAVPIAERRGFALGCWAIAAAAWAYGLRFDVGELGLAPVEVLGHLRLASVATLPPLGTIAVNLLLVPMAFLIWRQTGRPPMLIATLFMLLVNDAVGSRDWGYVAGNGAEVVFATGLMLTERFILLQTGLDPRETR